MRGKCLGDVIEHEWWSDKRRLCTTRASIRCAGRSGWRVKSASAQIAFAGETAQTSSPDSEVSLRCTKSTLPPSQVLALSVIRTHDLEPPVGPIVGIISNGRLYRLQAWVVNSRARSLDHPVAGGRAGACGVSPRSCCGYQAIGLFFWRPPCRHHALHMLLCRPREIHTVRSISFAYAVSALESTTGEQASCNTTTAIWGFAWMGVTGCTVCNAHPGRQEQARM